MRGVTSSSKNVRYAKRLGIPYQAVLRMGGMERLKARLEGLTPEVQRLLLGKSRRRKERG